ncbi:MAG: hypothetical protein KC416_07660 [Myxococcales bacterium]|nr:hypothetical protein [Myxococcales bacterium]
MEAIARDPGPPGTDLAALAREFSRAMDALDATMEAAAAIDQGMAGSPEPNGSIPFYRLRDVAIAAEDLLRALLRAAGVPVTQSVASSMETIVGNDEVIGAALRTLGGLRNAHTLSFLSTPPMDTLHAGKAAALTVATLIDTLIGDGYLPGASP